MIRKALIAAAALASVAAIGANQASAKVHINGYINVGLPGYGYVDPYPSYPVYDDYDDDCHYKVVWKKKWNWNHTAYKIVKKKVLVCY